MAREAIRNEVLYLRTRLRDPRRCRLNGCSWSGSSPAGFTYQAHLAYLNSVGSEGRRRLRPNTI